jgi:small subunit ribosomal protein S8
MSMTDPIADLFTRIRNAQATARATVKMPSSKVKAAIVKLLKDEGYVRDFQVTKAENNKSVLEIALKYFEGRPAIERIDRVSRSGLRVYRGKDELPKVMGGLGVAIVSTPSGIMTDAQARAKGVGGEVLGTVA